MSDILVVSLYILILLILGLYDSKIKTTNQYGVGDKQYSSFIIFCTLTASYIGGGFTIGLSAKAFSYGILYILTMFGFSIKEVLVAQYIAPRMKPFQETCSTTGDIMEQAYGRTGKILTGIASIIVCGGIIGAQFSACGNIFYVFFDLPHTQGVLITATVIITYVSFGGLKSVVKTNVFNFIILFSVIILVTTLGLIKFNGVKNFISLIPDNYLKVDGGFGYTTFIVLFLSFFFGETLVPPYTQRLLIGKSTYETKKGTLISGISSFFIFSMVGIIGILAYIINPSLEPDLAFSYAVVELLPSGLKGLGIAAMLAIIISSADAFLNAVSIAIKKDLLEPLISNHYHKKVESQLIFSRIITLCTGIIATMFALSTSSVLDILLYSYQFWTPFILVPLVAAIYQIKTSKLVFIISSALGVLSVSAWNNYSSNMLEIKGSLEGVIIGILINFIFFISLRLTKLNKIKKI